jgi:alkylation response protein AidB-like acyl-CoA dehydrogenase
LIDLELDDAGLAIRDAVARFCTQADSPALARASALPAERWRELAELGVLALATPEAEGGAREAVAALEGLGEAGFPGPLPATFFATQVLDEAERAAVGRGERLVSLGTPPIMPWAPRADLFLVVEEAGDGVSLAEPRGPVAPLETLGGEPWGRVELGRLRPLAGAARAHALHDTTLAAYAAAVGHALLDAAVEHARTRVQFGRAIGEFQAVAHPLADARIALDGARTLARRAACAFDALPEAASTRADAAAARISARDASLLAAHVAHQVFGAIGITLEGPAFHLSRRIRQLASQPPGDAAARERLLEELLREVA